MADDPELDQEMLDALKLHQGDLDGSKEIEPHMAAISEQILQEASKRSQELQPPRESRRLTAQERGAPIPLWVYLALAVALAALALALVLP